MLHVLLLAAVRARGQALIPPGMRNIERLGDDIERAFAAVQYDERQFPQIAQQALAAHAPYRSFGLSELVRWTHAASQIPTQTDISFGEPPVRLYSARRFYIEALFWLDGTTSIHQHDFSGAFQMLIGSSLHTRFTFRPEQVISKALALGELEAGLPELLRQGDTRPIFSASDLIHSTFHLDRPSVTLVVRTYREPSASSQLHFLPPGIAISSFHYDARLPRILQLFEGVFRAQLAEREAVVAEFLEKADLHSSILVLQRLGFIAQSELDRLLDIVCARQPHAARHLRSAVAELRRQSLIVRRRSDVQGADQRFLLALLLNVERRADILRLVGERVPGRDPIEQVAQWIAEISGAGDGADGGRGYLLGEVELEVFRHLLEERSVEQILDALSRKYDDVAGQAGQVRALCAAMQGTALLRPLLQAEKRERRA